LKKPTVYLDTNVISAYCYRGGDHTALARRAVTRDWWENEREHFDVRASAVTEDELAAGRYARQSECLGLVRRLRYLTINVESRRFAEHLVEAGVVPREKPRDALQMAVCAAHSVDYLLSWNYAHLVNPAAQE
jgi:predicted nucleic acid-binding protein